MKRHISKIILLILMLPALASHQANGQGPGLQGFSLKVSPGALTYYGDLSTNNLNLYKRVVNGSKFGFGAGMIKQFTPFFGIQAQFTAGSTFSHSDIDTTKFAGSLNEFSLSARFDPIRLIKKKAYRLSPYVSVGVATFGFRSVRLGEQTNVVILPNFGYNTDGVTNARMQTAMSMPMAVGISYKLLPFMQIELEHSFRITNTDLLDCYKGPGTKNDMYSLTSLGLRFSIPGPDKGTPKAADAYNKVPLEKAARPEEVKTDRPDSRIDVVCEFPESIRNGQTIDVKVKIIKGGFTGPVKLIQKYPEGFTPLEDLTKTQGFTFTNQNFIVDWDKLPSDSLVYYNYKVKVGERVTGTRTISGKLEYQEGKSGRAVRFNNTLFIETSNDAGEEGADKVEADKQSAPAAGRGNIRQAKSLPGIEYRVQCGAFKENSQADTQLAAKHKITELIQEEHTGGWYKYTVGSFRSYEEAARYRDEFIARTGILSAFIVAYKDGKRLDNINDAMK